MKKFFTVLILVGWLLAGQLTSSLEQKLSQLGPTDTLGVIIHLKSEECWPNFSDWSFADKRNYIKSKRLESQKELLAKIDADLKPKQYWITNCIRIEITQSNLSCLANFVNNPQIDWIFDDFEIILDDSLEQGQGEEATTFEREGVEWNIRRIKAPEVWALGYTGRGVVIGFPESGADSSHPALRNRIRKFEGARSFTSIPGNPYQDDTLGNRGHGTHVIGTACGDSGIGAAPGAEFIVAKVFHNRISHFSWLMNAYQWMAEMEEPPQIISNSWGSCFPWYVVFFEPLWTLRQLGFIIVFSNGNWGPDTATAGAPGNYPHVIGIGATDTLDLVAWFSSRGPSYGGDFFNGYAWIDPQYWPYPDWNLMKPDICAPGVYIRSSYPGGGYKIKMGTSMSTPHIAGVIALMLEKNCNLTHQEVYDILIRTADRPTIGGQYPNYDYGWGIVNALKAIEAVKTPQSNNLVKVYPTILTNLQPLRVNFILQMGASNLVQASVYDLAGRLVEKIFDNERLSAGERRCFWDWQDNYGQTVGTGVYFLTIKIGQEHFSQKIIFLRQKEKR